MEDTGPVPVDGPSQNRRGQNRLTSQRKIARREAEEFCQKAAFGNPKYRYRIFMAMQDGTINPQIERTILEIGRYLPKGKGDDLADGVRGLTMLLRKSLNVDPLAEAKPIGSGSTIIEQPAQEALPPRASIVPPARPKRAQGKGTLKPGEEELA